MTNFFDKDNTQDVLYFDGSCPMCTKEIKALRRLNGGGLSFVDVHGCEVDQHMPTKLEMLKVLHLMTAEGDWLKGIPATVRAWSHTRWGWLFKPLLWPLFSGITNYIYKLWAERRYERLYGCDTCAGDDN